MDPEDIKAVNAGLGAALLLAAGDIKPKPTDLETMHRARDAFARIRGAAVAEAVSLAEGLWQCRRFPHHPLLTSLSQPRCFVCNTPCDPA